MRFVAPPLRYHLIKSFPLTLLTASVLLTIGQSSFAYDFTIPETPSLPTNLPSQTLNIDNSTSANSGDTNPASNWEWYGPSTNTATNNDVHVAKQADSNFVFGGWSVTDSETVASNRVVIEKNSRMKNTYGGYSSSGSVENNIVEVFGSTAQAEFPAIYGGYSEDKGDAIQNMVFIRGGATVYGDISGGYANQGKAEGNIVLIEQNATANTTTINGGVGNDANENKVFIHSLVTGNVYAGQSKTAQGKADKNLLYIGATGKVTKNAYASYNGSSGAPSGSQNILIIEDGVVEGKAAAAHNNVDGTGNELHLIGKAIVKGGAGANLDGWQGNALRNLNGLVHVRGTTSVGALEGFDQLIFELIDDNVNTAALTITNEYEVIYGEDPILDLTSVSTMINGDALSDLTNGAKLIQLTENESLKLLVDNKTTFKDETNVFVDQTWLVSDAIVANGGIQIDEVYIDPEGNIVTSLDDVETILGKKEEKIVKPTVESRTLSESFLGTIAFVNQGAEFIADEGIRAMVESASPDSVSAFGAIHGGTSKYETGSHVDVDGVTLATGATTKIGNLMLAGFIEAGWASSESHVTNADGDGDHDYYGVGLATRYTFENPFYVDGSLRFGKASTEFDGHYAKDAAEYDSDSLYGSVHIGAGYIFNLIEQLDLDVYGRYIFTYLEGDKVNLGGNNGSLDMENTKTHAFRVGARLLGDISENVTWRFGVAYEHVSDGDAKSDLLASGLRVPLDVPTLEGNTGIVEAGFTIRPNASSHWSANFGLKGYVGDREGVTGNTLIKYTF